MLTSMWHQCDLSSVAFSVAYLPIHAPRSAPKQLRMRSIGMHAPAGCPLVIQRDWRPHWETGLVGVQTLNALSRMDAAGSSNLQSIAAPP